MDAQDQAIVELADHLLDRRPAGSTFLIGITGSVAVGKTTLAENLAIHLMTRIGGKSVEIVSTDGFLLSNQVLDATGLTLRKGFPESYDRPLFEQVIADLRQGAALVPVYSHRIYDIDPTAARRIEQADIVIVEGLGFPVPAVPPIDAMIYIDAEVADIESWFVHRFMRLWHEAENDPNSFYFRFRNLSPVDAETFARKVWTDINLPNLQNHIVHARAKADFVLTKARDHKMVLINGP
jgi:type I pantothenate kinase